jgi:glycosyltransferase involved in cell wall biosynthesis
MLTVIVPARNEADRIDACLRSLTAQSESIFELGTDWELILVDDGSTDATRSIAQSIPGVTVLDPAPLAPGWTGKSNACFTAAQEARGQWLLFTDADTVHEPGSLRRALHEAEKHQVALLSYSPRQLVSGLWQRALMPLIFAELALAYPPAKVSDPTLRLAAANGQFLLFRADAYRELGGHRAVRADILEDVELASLVKRRKLGLRFRTAPDALSTHMYRTTRAMIEGWTKNLALLFGNCLALAAWRLLDLALIVLLPFLAALYWHATMRGIPWFSAGFLIALLWLRTLWRFYARVARSHFSPLDCALSPLALPLFASILCRSWLLHRLRRSISWKGRVYPT